MTWSLRFCGRLLDVGLVNSVGVCIPLWFDLVC